MKNTTFLLFLLFILAKNSTLLAQEIQLPREVMQRDTASPKLQFPSLLTNPQKQTLLYIPNPKNAPILKNLLYEPPKDGVAKVIKIEQPLQGVLNFKQLNSSTSLAK